ncbi:hypothetical protein ACET3Z_027969 [Daucus carota]
MSQFLSHFAFYLYRFSYVGSPPTSAQIQLACPTKYSEHAILIRTPPFQEYLRAFRNIRLIRGKSKYDRCCDLRQKRSDNSFTGGSVCTNSAGVTRHFPHDSCNLTPSPRRLLNVNLFGTFGRSICNSDIYYPLHKRQNVEIPDSHTIPECGGGTAKSCVTPADTTPPGFNSAGVTHQCPISSLLNRRLRSKGKAPLFQLPASRIRGRPQNIHGSRNTGYDNHHEPDSGKDTCHSDSSNLFNIHNTQGDITVVVPGFEDMGVRRPDGHLLLMRWKLHYNTIYNNLNPESRFGTPTLADNSCQMPLHSTQESVRNRENCAPQTRSSAKTVPDFNHHSHNIGY